MDTEQEKVSKLLNPILVIGIGLGVRKKKEQKLYQKIYLMKH